MKSRTRLFNENRLAETQMRQIVSYFPPFETKIVENKKGRRGIGSGQDTDPMVKDVRLQVTCWRRVREGGGLIAPRERQTDRPPARQRRACCCSTVTEALCVCCVCRPTFGTPLHMKNAQVAAVAKEEGGSSAWKRSATSTQAE